MDMEIDEDFLNCIFENQKIERNYQNSKIMNEHIYQNDELLQIKSDNNKFYENQEIQNDSIKYLTSCSNLIFYNSDKNFNSIYEAKQQIKNNFIKIYEKTGDNSNDSNEFKNQLMETKNKIIKEKFKDNYEYNNLCELINQEDFDEKMKNDEDFRISIFLHKYFLFNEKYNEIMNNYSYLLPSYIYNIIKEKIQNNQDNFF